MVGFYLFEGSFFQGGGGWEHIEVRADLAGIGSAVSRYVLDGNWAMQMRGETCQIRVCESGRTIFERDLYPHIRVKVPGLTEVRFGAGGERIGGAGEPGGRHGHLDEAALWGRTQIVAEIASLGAEHPAEIGVDVDWDAVAVPELSDPVLGADSDLLWNEGTRVYLVVDPHAIVTVGDFRRRCGELPGGEDTTWAAQELDGLSDREVLTEDLRSELIEAAEDGGYRLVSYGYNSMFDPYI